MAEQFNPLQAYYDEGFTDLPPGYVEPENDRPAWNVWHIVCGLCVVFGLCIGVCLDRALS